MNASQDSHHEVSLWEVSCDEGRRRSVLILDAD
jgi:hypothetical protein